MDVSSYEKYRDLMNTGDALIFSGSGLVSQIIKWRTKSPYSHVALIARWKLHLVERVFLIQATAEFGVHAVPVSRYLAQVKGQAWWVPVKPEAVAQLPNYQPELLDAASQDFGRGYDFSGIGQFLLPRLWKQNEANRFCSETAASWWNAVGMKQATFVDPFQFINQPMYGTPVSLT